MGCVAVLVICSVWDRHAFRMDPNEPALLRPKFPMLGHLWGIMWNQSVYLEKLSNDISLPIVTLPTHNRKLYLVNSTVVAQNIFTSPDLCFVPFLAEFPARTLRLPPQNLRTLGNRGDAYTELHRADREGFVGNNLHAMLSVSLTHVAHTINSLSFRTEHKNLFNWVRNVIALSTSKALFGTHDPLNKNHLLVDNLSVFNDGFLSCPPRDFSILLAPQAFIARMALQSAYTTYHWNNYGTGRDVATLIRSRARIYCKYNIDLRDIGWMDMTLLRISTADVILITFFTLVFVAADFKATTCIREETRAVVIREPTKATLNVLKLEALCPLLVSAYRERQRLVVSQVTTRRVVRNTEVSDGTRVYLLRAGADVQIPCGIHHRSESIWGPDADKFQFDRFANLDVDGEVINDEEVERKRERKRAFFPFGGGAHSCPGGDYAFAQILAILAALIAGFDIPSNNGGLLRKPEWLPSRLGDIVANPSDQTMSMGAMLTRSAGWEMVEWEFVQ
ncbi:cytochrome P450 [Stipitochalara longipes BDJ]|nr:cytochrome P450 [Stipitochalara longipes BDJ]